MKILFLTVLCTIETFHFCKHFGYVTFESSQYKQAVRLTIVYV